VVSGVEKWNAALEALSETLPLLQQTLPGLARALPELGALDRQFRKIRRQVGSEFREVRKLRNPLGAALDPAFLAIVHPVVSQQRTLLGYDRLYVLWQAVRNTAHLALPVVEIGTFRGGSARVLAGALQALGAAPPELHVIDTFEGHLDRQVTSQDSARQRGKFADTSFEDVRRYLADLPGTVIHQGDATRVVRAWPERRYSFVHLDVDLFEPTRDCLAYFAERLAIGGVVVVDDYGASSCPGVARAVSELLARDPAFQQWETMTEQIVLVRR
jgi:predicted O-methyltransferase YrrM